MKNKSILFQSPETGIGSFQLRILLLLFCLSLFFCAYEFNNDHKFIIHKVKHQESRGNYWKAMKILNQAIEHHPKSAELLYERGVLNTNLKQYNEGIEDLTKVLELKQDHSGAYLFRSIAKFDLNDLSGALPDVNQSIALDSLHAEAFFNRGLIKYKLNDTTGAFNDFDKAIKIKPDYAYAHLKRGYISFIRKNYANALSDINASIMLDPENPVAYKYLAQIHFEMNDKCQACQDLKNAQDLGYD
jgi:tetratricopeptide (TPR) repeat protein